LDYVADTHALYWQLAKPERLGADARRVLEEAQQGRWRIGAPAIVAAELLWLATKQRCEAEIDELLTTIARGTTQFVALDFRFDRVAGLRKLASVPEMHDRLIVDAALQHGVPLLTRDPAILASGLVSVVW
jgi:PIN domain nuclease of toxin-antitoxin system